MIPRFTQAQITKKANAFAHGVRASPGETVAMLRQGAEDAGEKETKMTETIRPPRFTKVDYETLRDYYADEHWCARCNDRGIGVIWDEHGRERWHCVECGFTGAESQEPRRSEAMLQQAAADAETLERVRAWTMLRYASLRDYAALSPSEMNAEQRMRAEVRAILDATEGR